jgi:DNA-directed RNA polymerase subunit RPC12/RpoP
MTMATKKKDEKVNKPLATEAPVNKPEAKAAPKFENGVKCGNCGHDNEFGSIVCTKCGYDRLNVTPRTGDRVQVYH